ncbi:MAG: LlaJI family restriction endonuclease [Cetobacterium sp.]|uniref:LlaJI family restriction endonuclease n=2 Tax=Cetobacterium sp. TaxID=2071632 RepID=UPI003EE4983C
MKILYFKELKKYALDKCFQSENSEILNKLMERNIIIRDNQSISFRFVGMIALIDCIVIVFPKYKVDPYENYIGREVEHRNYIKTIFKVFEKYRKSKSSLLEKDCDEEEEYLNLFSLYKSLIDDFIENGLYENERHIHTLCGDGEIDWNKTIGELDNHFNTLKNPIYLNYYTHDIEEEQENYIRSIQKKLLTDAAAYFEEFRKFGLDGFQFDFHFDGDLIGDEEYQIFKIDLELRENFSERKINLLKLMRSILKEKAHSIYEDINIYGTKSYHSIWENVCQNVLGHDSTLRKNIPKPNWKSINNEEDNYSSSFIPDIVFEENNDLHIYDAKYYETEFDEKGKLKNNAPGIGDIGKQFLYEESYRAYYKKVGIEKTRYYNAFLFPTEETQHSYIGEVSFEIFQGKKIKLFKLSTEKMYENYLKNTKISLEPKIEIQVRDITLLEVDIIINSANSNMMRGSGLCGAIFRGAGKELEVECSKYSKLEVGEAILTDGYNLPAKKIVHTVAPKYYLEETDRYENLKRCYKNIIKIVEENKFKSIAIPCIGMGIYKWPLEEGAKIAIETVLNSITPGSIEKIYFICGDIEQERIYKKYLAEKLK